jgi:hypothetical protein
MGCVVLRVGTDSPLLDVSITSSSQVMLWRSAKEELAFRGRWSGSWGGVSWKAKRGMKPGDDGGTDPTTFLR